MTASIKKSLLKKTLATLIAAPLILGSGAAFANQDTHPDRSPMVDTQQNQKGHHSHGKKGEKNQQGKQQGKQGKSRMAMERKIWEQLDLTAEQKTQIETLKKEFRESMKTQVQNKSLKDSPEHHRQAMQALLLADNFDEASMTSLLEAMADRETEKKLVQAKHKHSLFSVLTDAQKETYKTLKAEQVAEMKAKKAERKEMRDAKKAEKVTAEN